MAIVSKKFTSDWAKESCLSNQTNSSDFRVKKYGRSIIPASFRAVIITDLLRRINKIPLKVDKNLFFFFENSKSFCFGWQRVSQRLNSRELLKDMWSPLEPLIPHSFSKELFLHGPFIERFLQIWNYFTLERKGTAEGWRAQSTTCCIQRSRRFVQGRLSPRWRDSRGRLGIGAVHCHGN